jgi:hypothetical protein
LLSLLRVGVFEFIPTGWTVKISTWPFYGIYKKQCERNGRDFNRNTALFFSKTMLPCTWLFDFKSFLVKIKIPVVTQPPCSPDLSWVELPVSKIDSLKICWVVSVEEMWEKFPRQLQHSLFRIVCGMLKKIEKLLDSFY